ncbi:50S ribosomal protein L4 [Porphyromonas miyakawae]|uniref:Large ribosomal subunit protein uL4 n=1 Tax=Porphyromonas miyakawae TaxID=3137470 RepID=A0ABQ0E0J4_9PORP
MELSVYNIKGEDTGRKVTLDDAVFGIEPNDHAIYLAVRLYRANQHRGTHKTKERSELSGSTRKLFRQKGTGGARRGDINSPLLRGGARVFGPRPRSYSFKLNKKTLDLARRSALTYKARQEAIKVIEKFDFEAPKTKEFVALNNQLGLDGVKSLYVMPSIPENVLLSARNLQNTSLIEARKINTYRLLDAKQLVLTEEAVEEINQLCRK